MLTIIDNANQTPVAFASLPVRSIFVVTPGGAPYLKVGEAQVFDLANGTLSGDPAVPVYPRDAVLTLSLPA